jgi:hypothetical protein
MSSYTSASDGILVDTTVPSSAFSVWDGNSDLPSNDIDWSTSATFNVSWGSSSDNESWIDKYWLKISSKSGGTDYVVRDWVDVGQPWSGTKLSTTVAETGFSIIEGVTYVISIKSQNRAGLYSTEQKSNGQRIDTQVPVPTQPYPDAEYISTTTVKFQWSPVVDLPSGTSGYYVSISTVNTVSGFNSGLVVQDVFLSTLNSQLSTGISGTRYYARLKVKDNAGNISNYDGISMGVMVDTTPPAGTINVYDGQTTGSDETITTSSYTLSVNWTSVTDAESGILRYWYGVGTTVGGIDVVGWTDNGLSVGAAFMTPAGLLNSVTYYFSVKSENRAGLQTSVYTSNGILVDLYPPSAPGTPVDTIPAGQDPAEWTGQYTSTTTLYWTWTASTGAASGITGYYVCLSTISGGADIFNDTPTLNASFMITDVQPGYTYYLKVRARSNSGAYSGYSAVSTGIKVDVTPALTATVVDDGQYTNSNGQAGNNNQWLHFVFSSTDTESGIVEYQYAVGMVPGGTAPVDWTTVTTSSNTVEVTRTGLTLNTGTTYYITVKTRNGTGAWSQQSFSDGIVYDDATTNIGSNKAVPVGVITANNVNYKYVAGTENVTWSWPEVTDTVSGLNGYYVSISTVGTVLGFDSGLVVQDVFLSSSIFQLSSGFTGTKYYVRFKYKDNAGNVSAYSGISDSVLVDTVPPSVSILQLPDNESYAKNVTPDFYWSTTQDEESGLDRYMLEISTEPDFNGVSYSSSTKNFSVTGIPTLPDNKYYWRVTGTDMAGNFIRSQQRCFVQYGPAAGLMLSVSTAVIKSDGVDGTTVTAVVTDTQGNMTADSTVPVVFTANSVQRTVVSVNGTVSFWFTSLTTGVVSITGYSAGLVTGTVTIGCDGTGIPSKIVFETDSPVIAADGDSKSVIVARLKDVFGTTVIPGRVTEITFSVNEYGSILGNNNVVVDTLTGVACIIIKSTVTAGSITLSGYTVLTGTQTITVNSVPAQPAKLVCTAEPAVLTADDGVSMTTVTVKITDLNNNVVNITSNVVSFRLAGDGQFTGKYNTTKDMPYFNYTENGVAIIQVKTTVHAGTIVITAASLSNPEYLAGSVSIRTVCGSAARISLSTQKPVIRANNVDYTLITLKTVDQYGNFVQSVTGPASVSVNNLSVPRQDFVPFIVAVTSGIGEFVYSDSTAGKMRLTASCAGLTGGWIEITNMVDMQHGGYYVFGDTLTKIYFPPWSLNKDVTIEVSTVVTLTGVDTGGVQIVSSREFIIKDEQGNVITGLFNRPATLTMPYSTVADEDKLKMFAVGNDNKLEWLRVSTVNKPDKTVSAEINHLSIYVLGLFNDMINFLYQNYPNPFSRSTRIEYSIQDAVSMQPVSIKVYNIAGDLVRTLVDKEVLSGTRLYTDWDARNDDGMLVSDGVYLCQLVTPAYKKTIKILFIKQ